MSQPAIIEVETSIISPERRKEQNDERCGQKHPEPVEVPSRSIVVVDCTKLGQVSAKPFASARKDVLHVGRAFRSKVVRRTAAVCPWCPSWVLIEREEQGPRPSVEIAAR